MSPDFIVCFVCSIIALLGHAAKTRRGLEWFLRIFFGFFAVIEAGIYPTVELSEEVSAWPRDVLLAMSIASILILFQPVRRALSVFLTALDSIVSGRLFYYKVRKGLSWRAALMAEPILIPSSVPHLVGLFLFIQVFSYLLGNADPAGFRFPGLPLPAPITIDQLFSYNGLGLTILAFAGVGVFVSRKGKESMKRLGLVKPTLKQVGIGISIVFLSFAYDFFWSIFTHSGAGDLGSKLSMYNAGTFSVMGGWLPSLLLALATAVFAGVGEETLSRGAIQPVLGILPAAILHGILHGQFAHAPIIIVQLSIWSAGIGIIKRYTNTTTTIIGHAGFNLVSTFLFAFNP